MKSSLAEHSSTSSRTSTFLNERTFSQNYKDNCHWVMGKLGDTSYNDAWLGMGCASGKGPSNVTCAQGKNMVGLGWGVKPVY